MVYIDNKNKNNLDIDIDNDKSTNEISEELLKENGKIMQSKTLSSIETNWKITIEIVNLTHLKLKKMKGLEQLVNIR